MGSIGIGIIYNGCIEEWEGINAAEILTDPLIFFKKISFLSYNNLSYFPKIQDHRNRQISVD